MKKVLIIMANKTGTGHKSAANALEIRLNKLGYKVKQIDGFETSGKIGIFLENSYLKITTTIPLFFYIPYLISQLFPNLIHNLMYQSCKRKMKKEILNYNPDLIISVHSMYNKAITKLLYKEKIDIPFYLGVIDLINPPKLWFNKEADLIFVPTNEIKDDYIKKGINKSKLIVSGFPIRDDIKKRNKAKKIKNKINILIVNPSINIFKTLIYIKEVSKLRNTTINVICGKDKRMFRTLKLEKKLKRLNNNVKVYEFVKNMNTFLDKSHILLTKAGPNMILEGVKSGTTVVVTGHIKGQENRNYEYVIKNDFGFKCENPNKIYHKLKEFIDSGKINDCLQNVLNADCSNGTEIITKEIKKTIK